MYGIPFYWKRFLKYYLINDITSSVGDEDALYGTFLAGKVVLWGEMDAFMPSLTAGD